MNLIKRLISGICIVTVTLFVMKYNDPFFYIFLAIIGGAMSWEWEKMVKARTSGVAITMASVSAINPLILPIFPLLSLFIIFISTLFIFIYLKKQKEERPLFLSLGNLYINLPISAMAFIITFYEMTEFVDGAGFFAILWLFITVWASDTGGYIFGFALKGPKLAPKISPKKTWSGFFGGIILALLASYAYTLLVPILPNIITGYGFINDEPSNLLYYFLLFTAITSVVSQVGDLFESLIKRKLEIKDSSNIIPGHGGVFDRFDGLLFASSFVCITIIIHFSWFLSK